MKLATLKNGTRDGELCVVSKNLERAVRVVTICRTMQQALDDWTHIASELQGQYDALNAGTIDSFAFDSVQAMSPLPRAYQWADGSAYVNHVELVRKARGAELPINFWTDPLMYQGGSDSFLGPCDPICVADLEWGVDFEAEVAVITQDVNMGCSVEEAQSSIALFMLVNDVSLRNLIPGELAKGFGFFQSKPSSSFSPVAVTPDELEETWDGYKLHLPLRSELNGQRFGEPNAGSDMTFDFPTLIAHAAKTRPLCAGSIIGSGTVSNVDRTHGSSCVAEKRMLEMIANGAVRTPFLKYGDKVRIEMHLHGKSIFGAIHQEIIPYRNSSS